MQVSPPNKFPQKPQLSNGDTPMENWSKTAMITYKRWRNPELRDELHFVGELDEDQGTDNEICTIASAAPKTGVDNSASGSGSNKDTFTIDEALDAVGFGKSQLKVCLITGLAWIGDAMEMMILSILGPQLHCEWRLPSYKVAAITAVVFVGMGIGSPAWGSVSNNFGRKACLVICMSWTLFYGLLSAFSPVYSWLLILRGLVGIGIGGAPQSVTMYSEFLPAKARGANIILIGAFWSIGAVLEVLLALWIMPTLGWRWLLGLSTIPMAIFVCLCYWLPESPRFEALTGRREKAVATLSSIAKENGKALPPGKLAAYEQTDRGRIKDLFNAQYWKTTVLLWFIWFSFAFCYYGIVLLTTELFQAGDACGAIQGNKIEPSCSLECNYLTSADYKDLLWTTLAEFPGLLIVLLLVDRIGRKKSLALGFFMFSLCILPLYACIGRVTLTIFIFIARAFISGGYQVAFVYTPEVFPTESRALAIGTSSAIARLGALVTPFVAQVLLRTSVYLSLTLYIACSLLAGVASLLLPIETLGRCLQESSLDQEAGESTSNSQTDGNTHSS